MQHVPILSRSVMVAYDALSFPVWIFSADTLQIRASNSAVHIWLGFDAVAMAAMTIADLRPEEEREQLFEKVRQFDGTKSSAGMWTIIAKSGHRYVAAITWTKVVFEGADAVVATMRDMTRVVQSATSAVPFMGNADEDDSLFQIATARSALSALDIRETRLKTAEVLLDLGSWEIDVEHGKLNWSKRVFEMYGISDNRTWISFDEYVALVHPCDRPQMLADHKVFMETDAPELEFQHRIVRADGTTGHIRGVLARYHEADRPVVIGFVQDISRFKEAEDKLKDAARLQRVVGQVARLGSWRVDLDPNRVFWSDETAIIHDEPAGISVAPDQALNYYIPEHRDLARADFQGCAENGQSFDAVRRILTAKGRLIWVRITGEAVRNPAGKIVAVEGAFQDISELMVARNATEALNEQLRRTFESITDSFLLFDADRRIVFLNSHAEALLQRSRADVLGRAIGEIFPGAVDSLFRAEDQSALTEGRSVMFQGFFAPLNMWIEVNIHPTADGRAVYVRDITQQQARDEQLRLLEVAVSRQNDVLLITEAQVDSPNGPKIVYVNDAFERLTGYLRKDVIGQTPRILQGPKTDRHELDRIKQALMQFQPVRAELINYTKQGQEIWLELDIVPLANETGSFTHWVAVERDITERKRTALSLLANEERFRLVAKATETAVWEWDIAHNTQWWSDGLKEIFGHEVARENAMSTMWLGHVHPDDQARADASLLGMISGYEDSRQVQYRFRRADGSWAQVEDRAMVVRDRDGKALRILGAMTDISHRLELEERLQQAQKMDTVGQLTGGVAHDFNNLLTIILGNAEILQDALVDHPDLQRMAQVTIDAADRAAELTSRLLAFSRKQALQPRVLDVGQLMRGMDGLLRLTLPENIEIEIIHAGGLWKTEVDAGQLESAIINLALNARDAMPDGGHLTIEMANAALDDDYVASELDVKAGQYVMITVTDSGHGIPGDIINRVFEPFFTTKEVGKGSGLGLSMVYGFVKQSGGHIRIYSEIGVGTTFKLYFRRSHAKEAQTQVNRMIRKVDGGTETILVLEDDMQVREYVTAQLKSLGYHVFEASDGPHALEILNQPTKIDLLFTDVIMPGIGGREVADSARLLAPHLKVLFTSGYTENSIVHNGRLDPGVDLLTKPYRRDQLAAKIRKVLDQK